MNRVKFSTKKTILAILIVVPIVLAVVFGSLFAFGVFNKATEQPAEGASQVTSDNITNSSAGVTHFGCVEVYTSCTAIGEPYVIWWRINGTESGSNTDWAIQDSQLNLEVPDGYCISTSKWPSSVSCIIKTGSGSTKSAARSDAKSKTSASGTSYYKSTSASKKSGYSDDATYTISSFPSVFRSEGTTKQYAYMYIEVSISGISSSDLTLVPYTLSFDYNGGSGNTSSKTVTYYSSIGTLPTPNAWTGHTFKGWSFSTSSVSYISSSTTYTNTYSQTVYAIWTHTLTFDYGGGTDYTTTSKTVTQGVAIGDLPTYANRGDYALSGWKWSTSDTSFISSTTKYNYNDNKTVYAVYESCRLVITIDGGGTVSGATAGIYTPNTDFEVTATPTGDYKFGYWELNDEVLTTNPLKFTLSKNINLTAHFFTTGVKATLSDSSKAIMMRSEDGSDLYIVVNPVTGYYVTDVVIDGMSFYLKYYDASLYGAGYAYQVHYAVKDTNNTVVFYFHYVYGITNMTINLAQITAPVYQNPPSGGASIEGVATFATNGGEARVIGFDTSEEIETVHLSAVPFTGYTFTGWSAEGADLSSYRMTDNIPYSLIKGKVVTANFALVKNDNINNETDNDDTIL